MSALAACRCAGYPDEDEADGPCVNRATQEDLLCDVCRDGCEVVSWSGSVFHISEAVGLAI